MRFSNLAVASLVTPLVAAHGSHIPGAPKLVGLGPNSLEKLRGRAPFAGPVHHHRAARSASQLSPQVSPRQGLAVERCGSTQNNVKCDDGFCCSAEGWCGQGQDYCQAPDCQFEFGSGCDANKTPQGATTRNVPRNQLGSVAYGGSGIYACTKPGTIAITYDDGPFIYTAEVLDQFKAYNAKATFFVTGINIGKGSIDDSTTAWPALLKRMVAEGHQVASHTWSHQDLSKITKEQRYDQMIKLEMATRNVLGKFPTYMRPPFSSCDDACAADLKDLGYVVSYFDLDTDDYNNVTPDKIQKAKDIFNAKVQPSNPADEEWLAIAHDIHEQTARNLTGYMLDLLTKKNFKAVTMGECMGDPEENWYRSADGASTQPSGSGTASSTAPTGTPAGKTSVDGTCGGNGGFTCIGFSQGECCSQYNYCGSSADHCGTGCNSQFGKCESAPSSSASATAPPAASSTAGGQTSPDGTCGGEKRYSCIGFSQGECCSQYNYCGNTADHCGTGCNPLFGKCGGSISSSTPVTPTPPASSTTVPAPPASSASPSNTPVPSPPSNVSKNGRCGAQNGNTTCKGSGLRQCCRRDGRCGADFSACGIGCQKAYGICWF